MIEKVKYRFGLKCWLPDVNIVADRLNVVIDQVNADTKKIEDLQRELIELKEKLGIKISN